MRLSPLEERIAALIEPTVAGMGYDLVCVQESGENGYTIQVMAENPKTRALGMEDCTALSRAIAAIMDVEDPVAGAYRLEVSSPGIDRLLVREEDYADYIGMDVKIEIDPPMGEQKRFRGRIAKIEEHTVYLDIKDKDEQAALPFSAIQKAKLVMSDELIKATQKRIQTLNQDSNEEEAENHGTAASR
ncbi:MAG TPA: ribosome maturation factor RimP [Micavibrio sp.]